MLNPPTNARRWIVVLIAVLTGCVAVPSDQGILNPPRPGPVDLSFVGDRPVIAYALGSGAVRGFAHVGVLRALDDAGITPDIIVGTSSGGLVGALYAAGIRGEALTREANELKRSELTDLTTSRRGLILGEALQDYVNDLVGNRSIEQLDTVLALVATNLRSGERTVFTHGNTGMAVRASTSIPGIFKPVNIDGQLYVDGGIVSPVPVKTARELGADVVLAVDVSKSVPEERELDGPIDVIHQTFLIMNHAILEAEVRTADVFIRPSVNRIKFAGFGQREQAMLAGEAAAREIVPLLKQIIESKGGGE